MFHVEQDLVVEIRFGTANCSMWSILPPIGNQHVPRGTDSGAVCPAILGELFHVERGRTISYSTTGYWNWFVTQTSLRLSGS